MIKKVYLYKCIKTINNVLGLPLFIEGEIYDVLSEDEETITLNHILYGNEYTPFSKDFINEHFIEWNDFFSDLENSFLFTPSNK